MVVSSLWETLIVLLSTLLLTQVVSQRFVRRCNDAEILGHPDDTYCGHVCQTGFLVDNPNSYCDATSGNCICTSMCSDGVERRPINLDPTVCPPPAGIPIDPDLNRLSDCRHSCATQCGGIGTICGESSSYLPTPNYASICICSCSGCPAIPPNTPVNPLENEETAAAVSSTMSTPSLFVGSNTWIVLKLKKLLAFCFLLYTNPSFIILLLGIAFLVQLILDPVFLLSYILKFLT